MTARDAFHWQVGGARVNILAAVHYPMPRFSDATDWTIIGLCERFLLDKRVVNSAVSQLTKEGKLIRYVHEGYSYYRGRE